MSRKQTGNVVCDEGACELSKALKGNTTLATLNLTSVKHRHASTKQEHDFIKTFINIKGNEMSDEGACSLSEALKVNSTLTALKLGCKNAHFFNVIGAELNFNIIEHNKERDQG